MKIRQFTNVAIFWILIGISLGCSGQPRVTVITSTMVGLEAKPPMGDAQPNPSVSLAYKRAEMALVPVCRVPEYSWWQEFMEWLGIRDKKTPEASTPPDPPVGTNTSSKNTGVSEGTAGQQSPPNCPSKGSTGKDAYAVLGSFQMAHNWFGPLNVRQFIATGMAARHLVSPTIHVIGEVKKPGIYPFKKGLTAEDAIAQAGGRADHECSDLTHIVLRRKRHQDENAVDPKATIEPDDIVEIPKVHCFRIIGDITKPSLLRYEEGLTIEKALEKVGGPTDKGKKVRIRAMQTDKGGKTGATRELGENAAVLPGDIIVVEPSPQTGMTQNDSQQSPQGTAPPKTPDTGSVPASPAKTTDSLGTPTEGK